MDNLEKGKFIIQDDFDEVAYLKVLTNVNRFNSRSLGVTIAPTLDCNFACVYCYERCAPVTMDADTVYAVKRFLERETKTVTTVSITWFGGEPLLTSHIIADISRAVQQFKGQIHFEATIITNGYLLTKTVAQHLRTLEVRNVQITLDGPPHIHDKRRMLKSKKGTFNKITDNIREVADILGTVVRVNVDASNVDEVPTILDFLNDYGLKEKVRLYFAPVLDIGAVCKDVSASCFSYETFSRHEIKLYEKAVKKGIGIARYPKPLHGYCGAVSSNAVLIDSYGNFHKCWNTVGIPEEAVGNVREPLQMGPLLVKWLSWDPFEQPCIDCRYFPLCMGGCPYLRRKQGVVCSVWKYNLKEMLDLYYTSRLQHE